MTSPTDEYLERIQTFEKVMARIDPGELVMKLEVSGKEKAAIRKLNGGLEAQLQPGERIGQPVTALPDVARFYSGRRVVGAVYFTENPARVEVLDDATFGQMSARIGIGYGFQLTASLLIRKP